MNLTVLCVLMLRVLGSRWIPEWRLCGRRCRFFSIILKTEPLHEASKSSGSVSRILNFCYFFSRLRWTSHTISHDGSPEDVGIRGQESLLCLARGAVEIEMQLCHSEFPSDIPRLIQFSLWMHEDGFLPCRSSLVGLVSERLEDSGGWHQLTAAWVFSAASSCTFLPRSGPDVLREADSCADTLGGFAHKCNIASLQPLSCTTKHR